MESDMKKYYVLIASLFLTAVNASLFAQGTAFSYQGRLFDGSNAANGAYDLTFALFDASSNGVQSGLTLTNDATPVSNGLFAVTLDFGGGIFNGTNLWLAIGVRTNGGGAFTALARQQILPVPYALYASNAATAASATSVAAGAVTGASIAPGAITATNIASGQVVKSLNGLTDGVLLAAGTNVLIGTNGNTLTFSAAGGGASSGGTAWGLAGNAGTAAGSNFVGTTDDQPLEVHVNGQRAMRFEPTGFGAPNVIGGSSNNYADTGEGATIAGGYSNTMQFGSVNSTIGGGSYNTMNFDVTAAVIAGGSANNIDYNANYSAIGGGFGNNAFQSSYVFIGGGESNRVDPASGWSVIGGGSNNYLNALYAVIEGGASNSIAANCPYSDISGGESNALGASFSADHMTIAGGRNNLIQDSSFSAIGGGVGNTISGSAWSVIAGGFSNMIANQGGTIGGGLGNVSGYYATVPGGANNMATGDYSFAAGRHAQATNAGCFVWNDSRGGGFGSTGENQFIINAIGGVGINAQPIDGSSLNVSNGLSTDNLTVDASISCFTISSSSGSFSNHVSVNTLTAISNISAATVSASSDISTSGGAISAWGNISTQNGNVYAQGMILTSDRNQKELFAPIESQDVLARVASLPITSWNFKTDRQTRHVGPMAQDFYAAFNVGSDDKHISVVDEGGVALAAIQGLNEKLQDELEAKDAQIQSLEQRLARLEKLVSSLGDKPQDAP
jgi:hypothetical protein